MNAAKIISHKVSRPATIERDVPIPNRRRTYPFDQMGVGESVLVPATKGHSARTCMFSTARKTGKKFISRTLPEGVRIWRVE